PPEVLLVDHEAGRMAPRVGLEQELAVGGITRPGRPPERLEAQSRAAAHELRMEALDGGDVGVRDADGERPNEALDRRAGGAHRGRIDRRDVDPAKDVLERPTVPRARSRGQRTAVQARE